jgi:O-antigen/teichoic acid export membrane protein
MGSVAMAMRVINLVAMVFLARLLEPTDFGLYALGMLLFSTANLFVGMGVDSAAIHSKVEKERLAFPAFLMTTVVSVCLFLIISLYPGFWAGLLGDPDVEPVIRVLAFLILMEGMLLIPATLLKKDLHFGVVSRVRLLAQMVDTGLTLALAFAGYGVWSLVYGRLAGTLARLIMFWVACPGWDWLIPRRLEPEVVGELFRYGAKTTGGAGLSFFNYNWDDWLVGRMLGSTALGFYSRAYRFAATVMEGLVAASVDSVLFPAYAKIQDEKERLSEVYIKSLKVIALVMVPVGMGVLVTAPVAVPVLLGEKWNPMVLTLQIFAVVSFVRPFSASTSPVFLGLGRPGLNFRAGLVVAVVMVPLAILLLDWGIAGVAVAVAASHVAGLGYNLIQMNRLLPGVGSRMVLAVLPAAAGGSLMMLGVQLAKDPLLSLAGGEANLLVLIALIAVGVVIYGLAALLLQRTFVLEAADLTVSALGLKGRRAGFSMSKKGVSRTVLSAEERARLHQILDHRELPSDQALQARILLLADQGKADREIAEELDIGVTAVQRTRLRFAEDGFPGDLNGRSRSAAEGSAEPDSESAAFLRPVAWSQPKREESTGEDVSGVPQV